MSTFLSTRRNLGTNLTSISQTDAEWAAQNPVLKANEIAVSSDNRQLKIGDGSTAWANLQYFSAEPIINESIADQALNSVDTYVTGSQLIIPSFRFPARSSLRFRAWLTKTAAGVAAPTFDLRIGAAGDITDTSRIQFVGPAQTGVVDTAYVDIIALLRNAGAAGVLSGVLRMTHNLDSTGFAIIGTPTIAAVSAGFDTTVASLKAGLSINPGAAGVWTVKTIIAELIET